MPWAVHDGWDAYWRGTEAGLLGAYDCNTDLIATDGSVQSVMGAGAERFSRGKLLESWNSQVNGGELGLSSHRPEAVALQHGLCMSPWSGMCSCWLTIKVPSLRRRHGWGRAHN
eukprot:121582-Rhodomonas_salina.1